MQAHIHASKLSLGKLGFPLLKKIKKRKKKRGQKEQKLNHTRQYLQMCFLVHFKCWHALQPSWVCHTLYKTPGVWKFSYFPTPKLPPPSSSAFGHIALDRGFYFVLASALSPLCPDKGQVGGEVWWWESALPFCHLCALRVWRTLYANEDAPRIPGDQSEQDHLILLWPPPRAILTIQPAKTAHTQKHTRDLI